MLKGKDIILNLLYKEQLTGYQIMERIQNRLSYFVEGSTGMVYPALRKLEKEAYITVEEVVQHDKPNKKIYTISEKGKTAVKAYITSPISQDQFVSDFLLRCYMEITPIDELIEHEKNQITIKLAKLIEENEPVKINMTQGQQFAYEFGKNMYESQLKFLHEFLNAKANRLEKN